MVKKATYLKVTLWHVNVTPNIAFQGSRNGGAALAVAAP
jgi:hypothetical protein